MYETCLFNTHEIFSLMGKLLIHILHRYEQRYVTKICKECKIAEDPARIPHQLSL
jgi:hypothetical protein